MGYTLDEIKGKHHRMFCEPQESFKPEYQNFWKKLGRGEFESAEYKRIGKDGREIWIQASYNPVFDHEGKPYKIVKFATDVTATKLKNADFEGKINSISKSQAIIEFNLDGTILNANQNFLDTVGYTLEEIKGKHHSMFCEPHFVSSTAYQVFWNKLSRGEFESTEFKRIGKGGREIWIQAS